MISGRLNRVRSEFGFVAGIGGSPTRSVVVVSNKNREQFAVGSSGVDRGLSGGGSSEPSASIERGRSGADRATADVVSFLCAHIVGGSGVPRLRFRPPKDRLFRDASFALVGHFENARQRHFLYSNIVVRKRGCLAFEKVASFQ